jgi:hypothetical protein
MMPLCKGVVSRNNLWSGSAPSSYDKKGTRTPLSLPRLSQTFNSGVDAPIRALNNGVPTSLNVLPGCPPAISSAVGITASGG